ncbi:restriction endonuclease (plasmid) [Halarchaeum sp. CBA1220]|uniref:restriction endonuclease n=1 Tax=Halarchaeum sp. CBA1220 TaxID=1853682 RepID=UPI000F3AA1C7|nr:restriction endonuclease [Halarchaeum sp. CBA1220]QLC35575.1 restriction endonuclease [Halarchaeum sp. CBA1220]
MFDSVSTAVETLAAEYGDHPDARPAVSLAPFFEAALADTTPRRAVGASREPLFRARVERLDGLQDHAPGIAPFDDVRERLVTVANDETLDGGRRASHLDYCDDLLAFAALAGDLAERYPDVSLETAVDALDTAAGAFARGDLRDGHAALLETAEALAPLAALVRRVDALRTRLESVPEPQFGTAASTLDERLQRAVAARDAERVVDIAQDIASVTDTEWTLGDLRTCSHREFEVLVADVWSDGGFDARPTKYVQDYNVDVVVEANGDTELIQAKQYAPDNRVGVETVQRTAGLIVEFDADAVYVVTSSEFTSNAETSAKRMTENVTLVDGERLCDLLNASNLVPPLS